MRWIVGTRAPSFAVADALATFDADACVVVTNTREHASYHGHGVPEQLYERFRLPTTTLTVDPHGRIVDHFTL